MSSKGNAVSITAVIQAARAAKADSTKVETYQDGTTFVQYLVTDAPTKGHVLFTPTRRWPSLPAGNVLVYKDLAGSMFGDAQKEAQALRKNRKDADPNAFFADLGTAPEAAEEIGDEVKGFGRDDRVMEVGLSASILENLEANASLSGEEQVEFFKGKTARRKAERAAYRTLNDPVIAELVKELRKQG
jgi:hypothetical protein